MSWQVTLFASPTIFATVAMALLAGYAGLKYHQGHRDPVVALLFWTAIAGAVWTGFAAVKLLSTDPATKLLFYRLLHVGAAALPPLLFLLVAAYTDRTQWLTPAAIAGVFAVPYTFVVLVFANPGGVVVAGTRLIENGLVILRVEDGPVFLVFLIFSLLFVMAGAWITAVETRRVGRSYYPQAALIGLALVVPILFGALTAAGVGPFADDRVNLVPTSALVSAVAFGTLVFRYRLFELPPLAYATAMRYSPDALFVLNDREQVVHANDHGASFLSLSDRSEEETTKRLDDRLSGFSPAKSSGKLYEVPDENGQKAFYRPFVESLSRGGYHAGWVVVLRDETESRRRERDLRRQNERMAMFASTVSHDLRNPLGIAQGYVDLARTSGVSDDADDHLDRVANAHNRMDQIVSELLLLAKQGRTIDELEPLSLAVVARRAWTHVETPNTTLSVETDRMVRGDPTALLHVFENLFRNAVEHGIPDCRTASGDGDGGGDSDCAGDGVANGEDETALTVILGDLDGGFFVADDGVGIPEADRDSVFDAGYTSSASGTGLGLEIVRTVTEAHDWTLRLGSDGGGARFEFTDVDIVDGGVESDADGDDGEDSDDGDGGNA